MRLLKQIFNNIGINAFKTLGFLQYMVLIRVFILKLNNIGVKRKFTEMDKSFSKSNGIVSIYYRNDVSFKVDLTFSDKASNEKSHTFGLVRELYIKDCYFKFVDDETIKSFKTIVDLGANRGIFSLLAAQYAKKVVYVEFQPHYEKIINHNLAINDTNSELIVINKFIGGKGNYSDKANSDSFIEFDNLFDIAQITSIDFLKIDIEGSEFDLFNDSKMVKCVRYISMEIHPKFGNVEKLISQLQSFGFHCLLTNMEFEPILTKVEMTNKTELYLYCTNKNYGI